MSSGILPNSTHRKIILFIFCFALAVRVLFFFFGTPFYFGEAGIQVLSDTWWWAKAAENLWQTGVYTTAPNMPNGFFYRPPGHAFFLLPFYVLLEDWTTVFKVIVPLQIILDSITAVLFYRIAFINTDSTKSGILAGILYSVYVFSLGWTAVTYPETLSVFFLTLGLYKFQLGALQKNKIEFLIAGAALGIAALMRIQLLLILPLPVLIYAWRNSLNWNQLVLKRIFLFSLGIVLTYGLWPIRNLVNHGEIILTQRLDDAAHWSYDFMSFREFVWSVKTDIEPEITYLMAGETIDWPESADLSSTELAMADSAIALMNDCGTGLRAWRRSNGYGHLNPQIETNCNAEIKRIWQELITMQKENNALHHYLVVPLGNLKKAFVKSRLVNKETPLLVQVVFLGRTILLILGLGACVFLLLKNQLNRKNIYAFILLSFLSEYLFFAFYFRSMEMRYLLQVDSLMLIPLAIFLARNIRK